MGNGQFHEAMVNTLVQQVLPGNKYYNKPVYGYGYGSYDPTHYQRLRKNNLYICKVFSNAVNNMNIDAINELIKTHHSVLTELCCYVPLFHLIETNLISQAIQLISLLSVSQMALLCTPLPHGSMGQNHPVHANLCKHSNDTTKCEVCYTAWYIQSGGFHGHDYEKPRTYLFDLQQVILDRNLTALAEVIITKIGNSAVRCKPLLQVCKVSNPQLFYKFLTDSSGNQFKLDYLFEDLDFIHEILRDYPDLLPIFDKNGVLAHNQKQLLELLKYCQDQAPQSFDQILTQFITMNCVKFLMSDSIFFSNLVTKEKWASLLTSHLIAKNEFNTTFYSLLCQFHQDLAIRYLKVHQDPLVILWPPCLHKSSKVFSYIHQSIAITDDMIAQGVNNDNCITKCAQNQMIDEFNQLVKISYPQPNQPIKRFSSYGHLLLKMATDNNLPCVKALLSLWTIEQVFLKELASDYTENVTQLIQPYLNENSSPEGTIVSNSEGTMANPPGGVI